MKLPKGQKPPHPHPAPSSDFSLVKITRLNVGSVERTVYEGTGLTFTDTNLTNNTPYTYSLRTRDPYHNYSVGKMITLTPSQTPPPAPPIPPGGNLPPTPPAQPNTCAPPPPFT